MVGRSAYFSKSIVFVRFIGFYVTEVVRANLRVAYEWDLSSRLFMRLAADASYSDGVAIFTQAKGGLMYEASVGGQKFKVEMKE